MTDYSALVGKPVAATTLDEETVRGRLLDFGQGPMIHAFDGSSARWQHWATLAEILFGDLTRTELLGWQASDPLGYLKAGWAWARDNQDLP